MPNHITTIIEGDHESLKSLLDDEGHVDFGRVIPPPVNIETGGCDTHHAPGVICWYQWRIDHWGTKWNAYDTEVSDGRLQFDSAWSHPTPVVVAFSVAHPEHAFVVRYADEDLGYNLGHYTIKAGAATPVEGCPAGNGDDASNDFAAQIKYGKTYAELWAEREAEEAEWHARCEAARSDAS